MREVAAFFRRQRVSDGLQVHFHLHHLQCRARNRVDGSERRLESVGQRPARRVMGNRRNHSTSEIVGELQEMGMAGAVSEPSGKIAVQQVADTVKFEPLRRQPVGPPAGDTVALDQFHDGALPRAVMGPPGRGAVGRRDRRAGDTIISALAQKADQAWRQRIGVAVKRRDVDTPVAEILPGNTAFVVGPQVRVIA